MKTVTETRRCSARDTFLAESVNFCTDEHQIMESSVASTAASASDTTSFTVFFRTV